MKPWRSFAGAGHATSLELTQRRESAELELGRTGLLGSSGMLFDAMGALFLYFLLYKEVEEKGEQKVGQESSCKNLGFEVLSVADNH